MERRPYFLFGDILVNVLVGALAASLARLVVGPDWHPAIAMLTGTLVGTVLALPVASAFMPLFGAFEVMLPGMLTGMLAGMVSGMVEASEPLPPLATAALGSVVGLISLSIAYSLTGWAQRKEKRGRPYRT